MQYRHQINSPQDRALATLMFVLTLIMLGLGILCIIAIVVNVPYVYLLIPLFFGIYYLVPDSFLKKFLP